MNQDAAHFCLNHLVPLLPHLKDKIEGVYHSFLLCPLHFNINADQRTSTAHTSTVRERGEEGGGRKGERDRAKENEVK